MSDTKDHLVVVEETPDGMWSPLNRFGAMKDAQAWLRTQAQPGRYHIVAFRYEDVEVKPPTPKPVRNEVDFGHQHITRERGEAGEPAAQPSEAA